MRLFLLTAAVILAVTSAMSSPEFELQECPAGVVCQDE